MPEPKKKPFSDARWNDDPGAEVIGHRELTPEEESAASKKFREILIKKGVIKEDEEYPESK